MTKTYVPANSLIIIKLLPKAENKALQKSLGGFDGNKMYYISAQRSNCIDI